MQHVLSFLPKYLGKKYMLWIPNVFKSTNESKCLSNDLFWIFHSHEFFFLQKQVFLLIIHFWILSVSSLVRKCEWIYFCVNILFGKKIAWQKNKETPSQRNERDSLYIQHCCLKIYFWGEETVLESDQEKTCISGLTGS